MHFLQKDSNYTVQYVFCGVYDENTDPAHANPPPPSKHETLTRVGLMLGRRRTYSAVSNVHSRRPHPHFSLNTALNFTNYIFLSLFSTKSDRVFYLHSMILWSNVIKPE